MVLRSLLGISKGEGKGSGIRKLGGGGGGSGIRELGRGRVVVLGN